MIIKVLGSAAGGGFPQWNCNCHNCVSVRAGKPGFKARTQSSLAVSRDGENWVLLNASPDLRQQIAQTPELWANPKFGHRHSPIKSVVVTNGDVDHIAGLINLREAEPFSIYGTDRVLATIAANSIFQILAEPLVPRIPLALDRPVALSGANVELGLTVEAFAVPGKVALYLEDASAGPDFGTKEGDTIGLKVTDPQTRKSFFYIPGCAAIDERLAARLKGAPLVFFDGTLFTDDEMIAAGSDAQDRRPHGPHQHVGGGRIDRRLLQTRRGKAHICPYQQFEPGAGREFCSAQDDRRRRMGGRIRRNGGTPMSEPVSLERISTERKTAEPMSLAEYEAAIRAVGAERYHDKHPFHHMLHGGKLDKAAGAGLGAQPLLLPVGRPAERRRPYQPPERPRAAPRMDASRARPRRLLARRRAASSAGSS